MLLNHGECAWDKENIITGWTDIGLAESGIEAAKKAGELLAVNNYEFKYAFVSMLKRSLETPWHTLEKSDRLWVPSEKSCKLNERHWGALQGLKKGRVKKEYGEEQVEQWMKSYSVKPPQADLKDKRFPGNSRMYSNIPAGELPHGESMEEVTLRVARYWMEVTSPMIKSKRKVIIAAHAHSLNGSIKHLERIADDNVSEISVAAGKPLAYEPGDNLFHINHCYLE